MKEQEEVKLGDFDPHVVHHRDPMTKRVVKTNPFRVIVDQGKRYYEWPKGSGNLWWENRHPAGRLGDDGRPVRNEAHVDWEPPVTADQKVSEENALLKQQLKAAQKEIESIQQEQELQKTHPAKPSQAVKPESKSQTKSETKADNSSSLKI